MSDKIPWPLGDSHLDLKQALLTAWGEPHRGYHNQLHLQEICEALELLYHSHPFDRTPVFLAAWFHDAVYQGKRDDEELSAKWASEALSHDDLISYRDEVVRLVELTATHATQDDDVNGTVFMDADLAILGSSPERYQAYCKGVRKEYSHYEDKAWFPGRKAVMEKLLTSSLFHTTKGKELWLEAAQRNIRSEIEHLDEEIAKLPCDNNTANTGGGK